MTSWGEVAPLPITPFLTLIESHFSKCVSPSVSLSDFLLHWLLSSSSWTMAPPALKFRWKTDEFQTGIHPDPIKGVREVGHPCRYHGIAHFLRDNWTVVDSSHLRWMFWKESSSLIQGRSLDSGLTDLILSVYFSLSLYTIDSLWVRTPVPNRLTFIQDFLIECKLPTYCLLDRTGGGCRAWYPGQSHGACIPANSY